MDIEAYFNEKAEQHSFRRTIIKTLFNESLEKYFGKKAIYSGGKNIIFLEPKKYKLSLELKEKKLSEKDFKKILQIHEDKIVEYSCKEKIVQFLENKVFRVQVVKQVKDNYLLLKSNLLDEYTEKKVKLLLPKSKLSLAMLNKFEQKVEPDEYGFFYVYAQTYRPNNNNIVICNAFDKRVLRKECKTLLSLVNKKVKDKYSVKRINIKDLNPKYLRATIVLETEPSLRKEVLKVVKSVLNEKIGGLTIHAISYKKQKGANR